jgi:hypothetical protein
MGLAEGSWASQAAGSGREGSRRQPVRVEKAPDKGGEGGRNCCLRQSAGEEMTASESGGGVVDQVAKRLRVEEAAALLWGGGGGDAARAVDLYRRTEGSAGGVGRSGRLE